MILQFKTLSDLREVIKEYENFMARPTPKLSHPTLYRKRDVGKEDVLLKGIRKKDWFFSEDEKWVLPHDQMGLSFSSHWQHLKGVYKMLEKRNPSRLVNVYWMIEDADIPNGLKFVPDKRKKGHYLLTVTEPILLAHLIKKLKLVAYRMSVIENAGIAL